MKNTFINPIKIIQTNLGIDQDLIKLAKQYEIIQSGQNNNTSFHSKFGLLNENHKAFKILKNEFKDQLKWHLETLNNQDQCINDNCKDPKILNSTLEDIKSWCLIQRKNAYCSPHSHFFIQWSCIYYCNDICLPEPQGMLEILNPVLFSSMGTYRTESIFIKPKKGLMILLPGSMVHWTHPILEDIERISYVCDFNAVEKYF